MDSGKEKKTRKPPGRYLGAGIAIGIGVGVAIHNIGAGLAMGIALGVALDRTRGKKENDDKGSD